MATTSIPSTCATVNEALLLESGRLGGMMYERAARKRPIVRLMQKNRGAWQNGMGVTVSAVTFERAFAPLTGDPWTTIAASDGDSINSCLPPNDTVNFGQTSRSYTPKHYSVNTEHFCIRDILFGWQYAEFLENVTKALEGITEWVWTRRYITDYIAASGHHLTLNVTSGIQDHASAFNTSNLPTSALSQGVLDNIYMDLWREGGDKSEYVDEATGAPAFILLTSSEVSDRIVRSNPDLRNDVRWAYAGKGGESPLLPGLPTRRRTYGNWVHELDPYMPRYIFTGSAYVEVPAFIASSTTKGNKWEQNPAYKTAPYELFIVYHEDTYQDLAVNTAENMPAGWNFTARNWMGSFSWRNILHETCNPDGTIGFFRALFASAAKPVNPLVGWVGLAARCGADLNLHSCYTS